MKKFIVILIFLGLLGAATLAIAPYLIGTETFKKQFTQSLNKATGYDIAIGGRIQIKLFPSIGARLDNITIHNMMDSATLPVLKARSIAVDVELMPLLHKEMVVKRLVLENPEFNLRIDSSGKGNWQPPVNAAAASPSASADSIPASSFLPKDFMLSDVSIENGKLLYSNEQNKQQWTVNALSLEASLTAASLLKFRGNGEWNGQTVKVDASVDTLENFFKGEPTKIRSNVKGDLLTLDVNGVWEKDIYTGALNAKILSIKDFKSWVSPSKTPITQDLPSLFSISGEAQCGLTYCHIANSSIVLDTIKAAGDVKALWAGNVPQLELNLTAGQVDLNLFLPAEKIHVGSRSLVAPANAEPGEGWSKDPMDLSVFSALNALINLKAESILIRNISFDKVTIAAKLQNGRLSFNMPDADFYNGKFSVNADMEVIGKALTFEGHWNLKGVQIGPLLKDALDDDRLSGTLDFKMDSERAGQSMHEMIYGVSGSGQLKITDGAFKGFNIAEMARNITSAFNPAESGTQKTDFAELTGTFTIVQGLINSNDLSMKAPLLRMTGKGQINMPLATIDARLLPQLVETAQGQGGKDKQALLVVPIVVEGPLHDPVFRPDVKSIARDAIQNPDKVKQQIKDGKEALKGLLKKF